MDRFKHRELTRAMMPGVDWLSQYCEDLLSCLMDYYPDNRERALAITKLEECAMWANKSITREVVNE